MSNLAELTLRAQTIFAQIVESYLATGQPVGSRQLADMLSEKLSPASIRATMAELEKQGLLYAPHVSAGRLPTQGGLRLFIDGLMQVGQLSEEDRAAIAPDLASGEGLDHTLRRAVESLSGLSACAGLVLAPNAERAVKHIEFMAVSDDQILVILVDDTNQVENRLIARPMGMTRAALTDLGNYLNSRLAGRTLGELRRDTQAELGRLETELGAVTARLVEDGLISWGGAGNAPSNSEMFTKSLIVHGQNHLLDDVAAMQDLDRIRRLFDDLDRQQELIALLSDADAGDGVKIFIGAETPLFSLSGSSLIISPYQDAERKLVGVLGVIAPTRTNYARLIPMVDHTAKLVSGLLSQNK
jgi:heat-inducible transcriptional repressor